MGRESRRAKVQGHNKIQSLENPAALLPQGLAGEEEQTQATVQNQCLLHTLHEFQELCGKRAMYVLVVGAERKMNKRGPGPPTRLTIIVDTAIVVLVTILHELFNVIFRNGLTCGLQHHLQLI